MCINNFLASNVYVACNDGLSTSSTRRVYHRTTTVYQYRPNPNSTNDERRLGCNTLFNMLLELNHIISAH